MWASIQPSPSREKDLHAKLMEAIIALAEETVKVLAFRSPLWKRGAGGDFIKKIKPLLSMALFFIKSPSIPFFQRGKSKAEYLQSLKPFQLSFYLKNEN